MFPGFVNSYKDTDGYVHIYFFHGIDYDGENIYNDIELSDLLMDYIKVENSDGSIDIKLNNKKIIKVHTRLVRKKDEYAENRILLI